jgi:hypothetical protein
MQGRRRGQGRAEERATACKELGTAREGAELMREGRRQRAGSCAPREFAKGSRRWRGRDSPSRRVEPRYATPKSELEGERTAGRFEGHDSHGIEGEGDLRASSDVIRNKPMASTDGMCRNRPGARARARSGTAWLGTARKFYGFGQQRGARGKGASVGRGCWDETAAEQAESAMGAKKEAPRARERE